MRSGLPNIRLCRNLCGRAGGPLLEAAGSGVDFRAWAGGLLPIWAARIGKNPATRVGQSACIWRQVTNYAPYGTPGRMRFLVAGSLALGVVVLWLRSSSASTA
jgi:hypothetical protein